jgi:hypothetical protein
VTPSHQIIDISMGRDREGDENKTFNVSSRLKLPVCLRRMVAQKNISRVICVLASPYKACDIAENWESFSA